MNGAVEGAFKRSSPAEFGILRSEFMKNAIVGAAGAFAAAMMLLAASPSAALECPVAHPQGSKAVLKETPEMIASISLELARGGAKAAPDVIAGLRARHSNASNSEIMNYLITAFCPAIKQRSDLDEKQKEAAIKDFDSEVGRLLFR